MGPMMKMVGAVAIAMTLLIGTASAEELTPARSRAIIERQFDAFERNDADAAYALAAPTIKEMFSDADHFIAMVRDHYAPVYRHRSVDLCSPLKNLATRRALRRPSSTTTMSCGQLSIVFGAGRMTIG